jgi:hypothetical protein
MAASKRNHLLKDGETVVRRMKLKEPLTVNCVCPKCGSHHRMKLIWSGRGMPKKFCPPCKIFVSSIEHADLCAMPVRVDGRID